MTDPFSQGVGLAWRLLLSEKYVSSTDMVKHGVGYRYANAVLAMNKKGYIVLKKQDAKEKSLFYYTLVGTDPAKLPAGHPDLRPVTASTRLLKGHYVKEYRTSVRVLLVDGIVPHDVIILDSSIRPLPQELPLVQQPPLI